jgi:hypothetical protein
MRTTVLFSLVVVLAGSAPGAAFGQSPLGGLRVPPPQVGPKAPAVTLDSRAFKGLFNVPTPSVERGPLPARPSLPAPRTVCGMRLIPGDPSVDPGIFAPPGRPTDQHHIRSIAPPICR